MRAGLATIVLAAALSGCTVTGAVVSVASTAVGVAADVGTAAVKGTYKAGKAVASTMQSKPEKPTESVQVAGPADASSTAAMTNSPEEPTVAETPAKPKSKSKSRVDRLAGY